MIIMMIKDIINKNNKRTRKRKIDYLDENKMDNNKDINPIKKKKITFKYPKD